MTIKCSMVFEYASNGSGKSTKTRTAGWTESFYTEITDPETYRAYFNDLCVKRAALLPKYTNIVGQRYQQVNPVGPSALANKTFPGRSFWKSDVPGMALFCKVVGVGVRNTRGITLKGIPDVMVEEGEYVPTDSFDTYVYAFLQRLKELPFNFRGRDLSQPQYPVMTVVASGPNGVLTAEGNLPYVVGDFVRVLKTTNALKRKVGGRFRVITAAGSNVITLANWNLGDCEKGQVRKDGIVFPRIGDGEPVRIKTAKVGRPFDLYRGRRSNR